MHSMLHGKPAGSPSMPRSPAGHYCVFTSAALFIAGLAVVAAGTVLVRFHWMPGFVFDGWLFASLLCHLIGMLGACVAIFVGEHLKGLLLLCLHLMALITIPALA